MMMLLLLLLLVLLVVLLLVVLLLVPPLLVLLLLLVPLVLLLVVLLVVVGCLSPSPVPPNPCQQPQILRQLQRQCSRLCQNHTLVFHQLWMPRLMPCQMLRQS
jgi:hypothetical protein